MLNKILSWFADEGPLVAIRIKGSRAFWEADVKYDPWAQPYVEPCERLPGISNNTFSLYEDGTATLSGASSRSFEWAYVAGPKIKFPENKS